MASENGDGSELWKILQHFNRLENPSREGFVDLMLLLITHKYGFNRVAFYEVDPYEKFAKPGLELIALAKPLLKPAEFSNKIDFIWYEIWHHEGRRARHGVSMMGPDYTHWHGTYEVAKHFYSEFIPGLEEIAEDNMRSDDAGKIEQARKLKTKIEEVLASKDHRWYINKMDSEEETKRKKAQEEFQKRYK